MKKIFVLSLFLVFIACDYSKDKLRIINNSKEDVHYETLIKNKENYVFYQISAGGEININDTSSPLVRTPIIDLINENSVDSILYIVFYNKIDQQYVYKNINRIIFDKKYITYKYSKKELDNMNWIVSYPDERRRVTSPN
jgi:hypothetical protein